MKKRFLSIALTLVMCLSLFSATFVTQAAEPTKITSTTTEWSGSLITTGKIEINSNVVLTNNTNLILADDAELTVNGTINAYGASNTSTLTVSTQGNGTGILNINGDPNEHAAYIGSITVNSGTVNITGGDGMSSGIFYGVNVNVSGGVLNVSGGNGTGAGVRSCAITMTGGEMNIVGSNGTEYGGPGMTDAGITMLDGVATVTGGNCDYGREKAFDGEDAWNDARMFASSNGVKYREIEKNVNGHSYVKFLPKAPTVSYIDAKGKDQKAKATAIGINTKTWTSWPSWMVNLENNTINGNLSLTDDTSLILGDGATLTINGSINTNWFSLTIYTQKEGTGELIINGTKVGITGNTAIYGGTISVTGGAGNAGFSSGTLTIGGKANVSLNGGVNNYDYQGASGAENCDLIVSDNGNITIKGNLGAQDGGFGMKNSSAVVTDNGVATISGADKNGSYGKNGSAFGGTLGTIDADLQSSTDGIHFTPIDEDYTFLTLKSKKYIRLTKKTHTYTPYLDGNGTKQTATDPKPIKEYTLSSHSWDGWMIASGKITIPNGIHLTEDTNLILADGANLTVNGSILCDGHLLTIYSQSFGKEAGTITVSGATIDPYGYFPDKDICRGIKGDLTVNGGNVAISGGSDDGKGYPGVEGTLIVGNGNVVITGGQDGASGLVGSVTVLDGKVTINAGNVGIKYIITEEKAARAALAGAITMYGGELYVNGSENGYGMDGGFITIHGGVAILTGGKIGGKGYHGYGESIRATIETSLDGKTYLLTNRNNYDMINSAYSLRLTPPLDGMKEKTLPSKIKTSPKTGDLSILVLGSVLFILCLGFATYLISKKKKI